MEEREGEREQKWERERGEVGCKLAASFDIRTEKASEIDKWTTY